MHKTSSNLTISNTENPSSDIVHKCIGQILEEMIIKISDQDKQERNQDEKSNKSGDGDEAGLCDEEEGNKENMPSNGEKQIRNIVKDEKDSRQRSGSVPSHKKCKQSDIQSISTMTGTFPSHKSDKRIEDIDPRISIQPQSLKDPESLPNHTHLKHTHPKQQSPAWTLDKNGNLQSPTSDITPIKYYFIKVATKHNMYVMRDLENLITVKMRKMESIKCLFLMCLPLGSIGERYVYQLEKIREKGKNGNGNGSMKAQSKFEEFRKQFYYELWEKGVLKLTNFETLTLQVFVNRGIIAEVTQNYEQAYTQFEIRSLSSEQELEQWQNKLIRKYKFCEEKIKQKIFAQPSDNSNGTKIMPSESTTTSLPPPIPKNPINQILLQRILLHEVPICSLYLKMQMDGNRQLQSKKKQIINTYTVRRIFEYLEIDLKLLKEQFLTDRRIVSSVQGQTLPYAQAALFLDELNLEQSPLQNISKIASFSEKLLQLFESSLGLQNSIMDMDNQLPLTIYCTLISKNTQLRPIISFLRDYFEPEDEFQNENRTIAALKAALEYVRVEWGDEGVRR